MMRSLRFVVVAALAVSACLAVAELGRRLLDGYQVWTPALVRNPNSPDLTASDGRPTQAALKSIRLDIDAQPSWFDDRPVPRRLASPEWAEERRASFEALSNYVWNVAGLDEGGVQAFLAKNKDRLADIFTFRTPDGAPYPHYRFYPDIESGYGPTNRFGWRSSEIAVEKPADVVRIAAVGDSTTTVAYPEMLEHWLNLWAAQSRLGVRFEVINAARPATGALDAAAIVDIELDAFDPDYVLVYGFGNGIYVADVLITLPPGIVRGQPGSAAAAPAGVIDRIAGWVSDRLEPVSRWSASAAFFRNRLTGRRDGRLLGEPAKPATHLAFPPDIDERAPDPEAIARRPAGGLMGLESYVQALDRIDAIAKERGMRIFVGTFRVMAFDGMLLGGDPNNGGLLYRALNEQYVWPYTYAQMHRVAEFYNRTLRAWASRRGRDVVPIDEEMPWQPSLYRDPIHELPVGEALHAWIALQSLMPRIREDLARHRLPKPARARHRDLSSYWTIARTKVPDAMAMGGAPGPVGDDAADEIADALPVSALALAYAKASIAPGAVPAITTAAEPTAYAASIPVAAGARGMTGRGFVRVRMRVTEGRISIGVLDRSAQKFLAVASLDRSPQVQEVRLRVDALSEVGSLMISNNRPGVNARSVAELHTAAVYRLRP